MSTVGRGKGSQSMRSAATVRRLMMYKQKRERDKKGKLIKQDLQSKELPSTRIVPGPTMVRKHARHRAEAAHGVPRGDG